VNRRICFLASVVAEGLLTVLTPPRASAGEQRMLRSIANSKNCGRHFDWAFEKKRLPRCPNSIAAFRIQRRTQRISMLSTSSPENTAARTMRTIWLGHAYSAISTKARTWPASIRIAADCDISFTCLELPIYLSVGWTPQNRRPLSV
jgi:hypothetical protein